MLRTGLGRPAADDADLLIVELDGQGGLGDDTLVVSRTTTLPVRNIKAFRVATAE